MLSIFSGSSTVAIDNKIEQAMVRLISSTYTNIEAKNSIDEEMPQSQTTDQPTALQDPVGFLLLQYSVLFTVESLSLLYLLFIS